MKLWYQVLIKHNKESDDGMLKQALTPCLFDAVSYTDAESRAYEWADVNVTGEFTIHKVTKTNIAEVVEHEMNDLWFKAKVIYSTVDGDSDREIKITTFLLVSAENVKNAYDLIEEHLNSMLVPFSIPAIIFS